MRCAHGYMGACSSSHPVRRRGVRALGPHCARADSTLPRPAAAGTFLVPVVGALVAARKLNSPVRLPGWPVCEVWRVDLPMT